MRMNKAEISCLLYQESGCWIAQGLEYDITAQASSLPEVNERFAMKIMAEFVIAMDLKREPFEAVASAPDRFWRMFHESKMTVTADQPPARIEDGGSVMPRFVPHMRVAQLPEVATVAA